MDARVHNPQTHNPADRSVAEMLSDLVHEGRGLARAEVNLYKQIALYRASKAKYGIAALGAALFILNAGLVAMFVALVLGLAPIIGPVAGGIVVFAAAGAAGYALVRYGLGKMAALSGDEEEKEALEAGGQRA